MSSGRNGKVFGPSGGQGDPTPSSSSRAGSAASRGDSPSPVGGRGRGAGASSASSTASAKSSGRAGMEVNPTNSRSLRSPSPDDKAGTRQRRSSRDTSASQPNGEKAPDKKESRQKPKVSTEGTVFGSLPRIADVEGAAQKKELFRSKLRECATIFDFRVEGQQAEKEGKRQAVMELIEHVTTAKKLFDDALVRELVTTIGANVFRTLTKRERTPLDLMEGEEEEPKYDPAWPHLEIMYELLLKFVASKEISVELQSNHIDKQFVSGLVELLDSDDPRERESLKNILNKISSKFASLRSHLKKAIQHACMRAIYEDGISNGVGELLEILNRNFISHFSTPLKEENKKMLLKVLMPMHKVCSLNLFHWQIHDCVKAFTGKDPKMACDVVRGLLQYWPTCVSHKGLLFLEELESMMGVIPDGQLKKIQTPLAHQLARCLVSPNSEIAEKTLIMLKSSTFVKFTTKTCKEQFPLIVSALYGNLSGHWHGNVQQRTIDLLRQMMEADNDMFDTSSAKHRKKIEAEEKAEVERAKTWAMLQDMHDRKQERRRGSVAAEDVARRSAAPKPKPKAQSQRQQQAAKQQAAKAPQPQQPQQQGTAEDTAPARPRPSTAKEPVSPKAVKTDASVDLLRGQSNASLKVAAGTITEGSLPGMAQTGTSGGLSGEVARKPTVASASPPEPASPTPKSPDKRSSRRGPGQSEAIDLQTTERYGVALSWDRASSSQSKGPAELGLQALTVDERGKITGAVHDHNLFAHRAAIEYCPSGEAAGGNTGCDGITWVSLHRLPQSVVLVVFVLAVHDAGQSADATNRTVHLFEGSAGARMARHQVQHKASDACSVAVMRRAASSGWKMHMVQELFRGGRHFMDCEKALDKVVRELVPSLPKRLKVSFAFSSMQKGEVVDLPQPDIAKWLFVGVSWDLGPGSTASLVVSAVMLDVAGQEVGAVTSDSPRAEGARHSGSRAGGALSTGVALEQGDIPAGVFQIFLVGHVHKGGMSSATNAELIQKPDCTITDPTSGLEMVRFTSTETYRKGGLILARIFRMPGRGRWAFQAIGETCEGNTWQDSLKDVGAVAAKAPQELQLVPEASTESSGPRRFIVSL